jgi:hypothetical protein
VARYANSYQAIIMLRATANQSRVITAILGASALALTSGNALAQQVCPFDDGRSSLAVEGVILTRYALGLTGAPLVASTSIAAADAPTVEGNINCPSCGLNLTGNATMTVADATIISRKLAGFAGDALTNGLALGSGTRNTPAAVQSFLLAGCGATGGTVTSITAGTGLIGGTVTGTGTIAADTNYLQRRVSDSCAAGSSIRVINADGTVACQTDATGSSNAFVQGGNAFGTTAILGTTDAQQMEIRSAGNAVKLLLNGENGLRILRTSDPYYPDAPAVLNGSASNSIGLTPNAGATIAGGGYSAIDCNNPVGGGTRPCANRVSGAFGSIGGGVNNRAGIYAIVSGGSANSALGDAAAVSGGTGNSATGTYAVVSGGYFNLSSGLWGTVSGGSQNAATGLTSTVPGGSYNTAAGNDSFAAGQNATAGDRTFVWNSYLTGNNLPTRTDSFRVQAANGFDVAFGPNRDYFVAFNADTAGFIITTSTGAKLSTGGVWTNNSDRAQKRDFSPITTQSAQDILRKVVALPLSTWSYFAEDAKIRHIGPMAQDFWKAFGLGYDDKTMTDIDARGVTLAAIQGLNQIVKDRDGEIAQLKSRLAAIERRLGVR